MLIIVNYRDFLVCRANRNVFFYYICDIVQVNRFFKDGQP